MLKKLAVLAAACAAMLAAPAMAQNITAPAAPVPEGIKVDTIKVHSPALEGNLEGNSTDREALVVLPPSYGKDKKKRYRVVYYLHGFAIDGRNFYNFMKVPDAVNNSAKRGEEFIVVVPDTLTKLGGSMYSTSVTTGDFRAFVAKDLVAYVDSHYRTIAKREGRGLAGHSMGGYGTWVIGMTYPETFAAIYAQNACCISPRTETEESAKKMASVSIEDGVKADFGMRAGLSSMVAWSPNPQNPPYFADFPYKDGKVDQLVIAKWAANSPYAMVASHVPALRSFRAIGSDAGDKDGLLHDDTMIHEELDRFGIVNQWAVYDGDHVNRIGQRFDEVVLPFMAKHLDRK
ncbi:hypothetical protein SZ64_15350 [Erythrobacter sp. SG61-1L]|uniref:alpha/beta hydrolase n=1 Tax=Erythrobacter sp. SG61-1L TaxID=1603897 RepID=UPI0006C90006|nr:alpha/beta hydrolase-fold protein [Erythrobacter sp. SG61-1L]KPL69363.1 hypothetical protein SZ64_15350 [Erythrobacter sp. SG61-1L]